MKTELLLREDDQTRDESFKRDRPTFLLVLRTILIATPVLVGGMYLLMRDLPKDAFPPNFWMNAFLAPSLGLSLYIGVFYLTGRFVHRRCILTEKYIRLGFPGNNIIAWRQVAEWRIEDVREDPQHFRVEFHVRGTKRKLSITLPNTYSREEIRAFILYHLAKAY